ncbi:MAG: hypothetical protein AWM53_00399 [Candidatus Dichloromethanomonas elyunquensis]|nr:MAG: hypothetical protein AWM53_00399 [Candidatus Dichloromethanomonas elyunquensis]
MIQYLTIQEAADRLRISKQTIYNKGPAMYGGQKIGGLWRFPEDKLGMPQEKPKEEYSGYIRAFPNKRKKAG